MSRTVLHVSETTDGGVGRALLDVVAAQASAGWRVHLACPPWTGLATMAADTGGGLTAWEPGARPAPRTLGDLTVLHKLVRRSRPDLVHLHSSMAGLCGRLVVRGRVPTLFQPHAWSFYARGGLAGRAALAWESKAVRWADAVLCVSEDERRAAQRAGMRGRFEVVANGVDLKRFRPVEERERERARTVLGTGGGPLAVCVGRLHRQKGQHLLLDAWPDVLSVVPDATLALVGDGPDRPGLVDRRPRRTLFAGQTERVADWLAAADVVVQPSAWEGMSLTLLEAMACARSVVVTDVPGMAEVVLDGCGAVVPPGDPQLLAQAVAGRLRDPQRTAAEGAAGRLRVERHHDLAVQLEKVLALGGDLMNR